MEPQQIQTLTATFEGHAQRAETGVERWLACDLQHLLGYGKWDNFQAKTACELSGHAIADHFADVGKMIELGKGGHREIDDVMLTSNLIAQTYFATEITIHNARTQQMQSEKPISSGHVTNNEAVRQTFLSRKKDTAKS